MVSFLLHFVPFTLLSLLLIHIVFRKSDKKIGGLNIKVFFILLVALYIYRPFVIATWMISPAGMIVFVVVVFLWRARKGLRSMAVASNFVRFITMLIFLYPLYLAGTVLLFSITTGYDCGRMEKQRGLSPIFSLCDKKNVETAKSFTDSIFHCRNGFPSASRELIYVGFGAETNPDLQALLGVDVKTGEIKRKYRIHSVFRGYCNAELKTCIFLVSPMNTIRLWNDEKEEVIKDFFTPRDRPRFMSVDSENPDIVYVASDADWIAEVNLRKQEITRRFHMPNAALATVSNTPKRVIANTSMFFRPFMYAADKKTGKTERIAVGMLRMWKNWGFFFHVEGDPDRERAFIGAPMESAVYMVDLERKRVAWRYQLPIGIRDLGYDSRRQVLYASNFVNGYVYKIDVSGEKPVGLGKIYVGRRVRYFNYEPDEDFFIAASANGFFKYSPADAGP